MRVFVLCSPATVSRAVLRAPPKVAKARRHTLPGHQGERPLMGQVSS